MKRKKHLFILNLLLCCIMLCSCSTTTAENSEEDILEQTTETVLGALTKIPNENLNTEGLSFVADVKIDMSLLGTDIKFDAATDIVSVNNEHYANILYNAALVDTVFEEESIDSKEIALYVSSEKELYYKNTNNEWKKADENIIISENSNVEISVDLSKLESLDKYIDTLNKVKDPNALKLYANFLDIKETADNFVLSGALTFDDIISIINITSEEKVNREDVLNMPELLFYSPEFIKIKTTITLNKDDYTIKTIKLDFSETDGNKMFNISETSLNKCEIREAYILFTNTNKTTIPEKP